MDDPAIGSFTKTENNVRHYLILFLFGTLLAWYIQYLWDRRKLYFLSHKIPGPFAFPFIGNMHLFFGNGYETLNKIDKLCKIYPDILKIWLGQQLVVSLTKPEYVEKVLTNSKAMSKPYVYDFLKCALGDGLLTSPTKTWRRHRKLISPSFNQKILNSFVEIFSEQSVIFAEQLKSHIGKKNINFYHFATRCTLDIICQTAMGINMNMQTSHSNFGENIECALEVISFRMFHLPYHMNLLWKWSEKGQKCTEYIKELHSVTSSVIRKKIEEHDWKLANENSCLNLDFAENTTTKRKAFLDLVLENSEFTEEQIREQVDTFLLAGTETTAATLCCVCMILGMFPDIQEKVYEEIIDILGKDKSVTPEDLPKMKYTERVIRETMRLFPLGPIFGRYINEDLDIGDKIILPADTIVIIGMMNIHRNPKYWANPLKFDPDRFLPEEISKRHPCTYCPFSFGPRICIGWRYAMLNLKTIIATLVREYKFFSEYKSIQEVQLKIHVVLRLNDGPKLWIESRET